MHWITDAQKWFTTSKLGPLLQKFCERRYGTSRSFIFPAETRFGGKLLQLKRFLSMRDALQQLVESEEYTRYDFEGDIFAERLIDGDIFRKVARITKAAGPVLLLLRIADSNSSSLSKLKGTVDYISSLMIDNGNHTLEDQIAVAFRNRAPELECDVSNAAYVLDPQFVSKSRNNSDTSVMKSFWKVSREVLRITDDTKWRRVRHEIVGELASFRMRSGGFAMEEYGVDTCAFWAVAGCHAPTLRKIGLCLTPLPCSSGAAERNWQEVKLTMTKKRNRLDRAKVEKMMFVRRFEKLKRNLFDKKDNGFKEWVQDLFLKSLKATGSDVPEDDDEEGTNEEDESIFRDHIEPGEQGRINGKEPGKPTVTLTNLRKDNIAKSWLFEKYYGMKFVDKNPEGDAEDDDLTDESCWEHRVIKNIVWWRLHGYSVETHLYGDPESQSIEKYLINSTLHNMIRDSPHNTRPICSQVKDVPDVVE